MVGVGLELLSSIGIIKINLEEWLMYADSGSMIHYFFNSSS